MPKNLVFDKFAYKLEVFLIYENSRNLRKFTSLRNYIYEIFQVYDIYENLQVYDIYEILQVYEIYEIYKFTKFTNFYKFNLRKITKFTNFYEIL